LLSSRPWAGVRMWLFLASAFPSIVTSFHVIWGLHPCQLALPTRPRIQPLGGIKYLGAGGHGQISLLLVG
jgi:hypothetical protein